uniref:Nicolin 1 n=1 Tax=Apteryx owenii TaxID=8824 RepID=A0A8B9S8F1_APTOW
MLEAAPGQGWAAAGAGAGAGALSLCGCAAPQLQEIVFRNFYTAFLSVRVQRASAEGPRKWVTCLRDYRLMPSPHTEEGSQDYFSLFRHQMLCDVDQVTAVRFILRQPSPVWLHFTIEELQIYPPSQKSPQKDFPSWLSQLTPPEQPANLHGPGTCCPCGASQLKRRGCPQEALGALCCSKKDRPNPGLVHVFLPHPWPFCSRP